MGHECRWLASIYCPSLVALAKMVMSCLLETLQSMFCGLTHNAVREGIPGFSPSDCKGTVIFFKVRTVSGLEENLQVVMFPCICCPCPKWKRSWVWKVLSKDLW